MSRQRLTALRPQAYEHPLDAAALDALQNTAGLETLVRKCNEWGFERLLRVQLTGSNLRVTADNFPDLHGMLREAADILDVPKVPELYIAAGGEINAFTAGVEKPIVVVNAGAVDLLTDDELLFVIAHELGHVKSGHVLYYQMAQFLPVIGEIVGSVTLGISNLFSTALELALLNWRRTSEFTADRAGLLACQDLNVAITTMIKIAGLPQKFHGAINTEDFEQQARDFEAMDADKLSWIAKGLSVMGQSHPWTVMRAQELLTWVDSAAYDQILKTDHAALPAPGKCFCANCGRALTGAEIFCPGCGTRRVPPALAAP